MNGWLSASWEPSWRSLQYFNLYRLIVAALLVVGVVFSPTWRSFFHISDQEVVAWIGGGYLLVIVAGMALSVLWQRHFDLQLTGQVVADVVAVGFAMYGAEGAAGGLGVLLLISLAAASLVGRTRLVLFYAAVATIVVLLQQIFGIMRQGFEPGSIVLAGFLSAGFFATAILARLLGQRLMANEELARLQAEALENQGRVSERVSERMQDGVLVVGPDGQVVRQNPMASAMLGEAGRDTQRLGYSSEELEVSFFAWLREGGAETAVFQGVGGNKLRARFVPTESTARESLIFVEDVGRIQEQAQQLKLAALGRLTASIAHEIRNPLSAISHAGDLLREERRGEMQERLLKILQDNVARLDRIVSDILELGRRDRAQPERLALADFMRSFVNDFVHGEQLAEGVVTLQLEAGLNLCFDRSHLHQVLWNLVGNACRHGSGRPGSVSILAAAGNDAAEVELHVIDDGPGVPEAYRSQVFEPFFTTHVKGTGLGLYIARELCEANSASLGLEPEAAGGHFVIFGRNDTCQ